MRLRLLRSRPELRHHRSHRGPVDPVHLRLHRVYLRDHGELLSVMLALLLTLLHHSLSYIDRCRVRAAMPGVEVSPVHLFPL